MSDFQPGLSADQAHARLRESLQALQRAEKNAVLWFDEIRRRRLYRALGYSSIHAYAVSELGFSKSRCSQFIRLTESLEKLPKLRESVARGEVAWTKVREVVKVASPANEARWVAEAKRSSRRELEAKVKASRERAQSARRRDPAQASLLDSAGVAGKIGARAADLTSAESTHRTAFGKHNCEAGLRRSIGRLDREVPPGKLDSDEGQGRASRTPELTCETPVGVSLRFTPEQFARYETLVEQLRKQRMPADLPARKLPSGREELLLAGLAALLDSISMTHEDGSHAPNRKGRGNATDPVHENAETGPTAETRTEKFPRVNSGPSFQIIVHKCEDCGQASVISGRGDLALSKPTLDRIECDSRTLKPGKRNKSSIPPGLRRRVLARDGHRCQAPGCGSTRFLEVHHVRSRAAGGGNEAENLVTLCASCHQLLHEMSAMGERPPAWIGAGDEVP